MFSGDPARQQHHLRRQRRQLSHGCRPNSASQIRVNTRVAGMPPRDRTNSGAAGHVRRVGGVAGQPQRDPGLDGGRQVARAAEERGPGAVRALLGADPAGRLLGLLGGADAEELPQQQVLGVHGHVGLELALPPALGRLQRRAGARRPGVERRRASGSGPLASGVRSSVVSVISSPVWSGSGRASASSARGPGARLTRSSAASAARRCSSGRLGGPRPAAAALDQRGDALAARPRRRRRPGAPAAYQAASSAPAAPPPAEHEGDRQRLLAGAQVGEHRLAGHGRVAPDAQQVVDQLERQPPGAARASRSASTTSAGRAGQHRADAAAGRPAARRSCRRPCRRHSSRPTLGRASRRRGPRPARGPAPGWPTISSRVAAAACGESASSSTSAARPSIASPVRIAHDSPHSAHTVRRCRRSTSPSMTSSCSSEKLCTSSTATAPGTRDLGGPRPAARPTAAPARAGRPCPPPSGRGEPSASVQPRW